MRIENRKNDELREVKFTVDYTKHAPGSVLVEFGDTKVITTASVEQGKPKWMDKDDPRGWLTAEYSLLPTSTSTRCKRERSKVSGRTYEIQRLIGRSLRAAVDLTKIPDLTITIDADVIQADGGTRTASICGGYVALCEAVHKLMQDGTLAQNPIVEPIAAISAGIVDGEVRLDLNYEEDSHAQVDSNIVLTKSGKIVDFQTTAEGGPYEYDKMIEIFNVAKSGIEKIIAKYPILM
ncbi:MAG: ribonuclease PH [Cyanobacteriota bacterium]|nr:ribonuclease PH [Cyanobacteriota bacterium]MDY6359495.1 ribonuclease PH [Cyanobacteriota bacterium]MDY6364793.1 ribonuclease PH [Cyanobacteriota bacterium]MDY6383807.1 ribonuclease PH [Cyanobacteriota bacterium]